MSPSAQQRLLDLLPTIGVFNRGYCNDGLWLLMRQIKKHETCKLAATPKTVDLATPVGS